MVSFKQQSFNGKSFRPRPEVLFDQEQNMLIIVTSWGAKSSAKKAAELIRELYLTSKTDDEVTSPFEYLTCISPEANHLRKAIMMTNDQLYQDDNRDEYVTGVELLALVQTERFVVWTQIGQPQLIIYRADGVSFGFGSPTDLQVKIAQVGLDPLPSQLLGTASTSHFSLNEIKVKSGDQLFAVSRAVAPIQVHSESKIEFEDLTKSLVEQDPNAPFWVGAVEF